MASKKYTFTLKGISISDIDKKCGISILSNVEDRRVDIEDKITDISKLSLHVDTTAYFSFLNETKKNVRCLMSFSEELQDPTLITSKKYNCFWCRHPILGIPVGCPISHVPNKFVKKYYSEITKQDYIIKGNIKSSYILEDGFEHFDYYYISGVCCSFNCALSLIRDNKKDPLFMRSESLLVKIYFDLFGSTAKMVSPAPHWRLLSEYGGSVDISKFREGFNQIIYKDLGQDIYKIPRYYGIGHIYEEIIKF